MSSDLAQLADAITDDLNAHFAGEFTAVRRTLPIIDLKEFGDAIRATVVPRSVELEGGTRAAAFVNLAVDIGVQKRIDPGVLAEGDAMLALVQAIGVRLRNHRLDDAPGAAFVSMTNDPAVAADHLAKHRVFTSVLTITYRVARK